MTESRGAAAAVVRVPDPPGYGRGVQRSGAPKNPESRFADLVRGVDPLPPTGQSTGSWAYGGRGSLVGSASPPPRASLRPSRAFKRVQRPRRPAPRSSARPEGAGGAPRPGPSFTRVNDRGS